jgi:hypothetical protein
VTVAFLTKGELIMVDFEVELGLGGAGAGPKGGMIQPEVNITRANHRETGGLGRFPTQNAANQAYNKRGSPDSPCCLAS